MESPILARLDGQDAPGSSESLPQGEGKSLNIKGEIPHLDAQNHELHSLLDKPVIPRAEGEAFLCNSDDRQFCLEKFSVVKKLEMITLFISNDGGQLRAKTNQQLALGGRESACSAAAFSASCLRLPLPLPMTWP